MTEPTTPPPTQPDPLHGLQRNTWPYPKSYDRFFGALEWGADGEPTDRWEHRSLIKLPVPFTLRLAWQPQTTIRRFRCSRQVRHSLARILSAIWQHYDHDGAALTAEGADLFGGCYIRADGAPQSSLTLHARGAAIRLGGPKPPAFLAQAFAREDWTAVKPGLFQAAS